MIGVKTIGLATFVLLAVGMAAAAGVLSPGHVAELSATTCLIIGVFAGVATPLAGLGWRPAELSRVGLPPRAGDDAPWDLPALAQSGLFAAIFVCVGLVAFGNREAGLLASAPARMVAPGGEYCPEPGTEEVVAPPVKPEPAVDVRGCALIKRAYELGYAKDLGACAPKPVEEVAAELEAPPVCEKRQRDEPFWHWNWRQWHKNAGGLTGADPIGAVGEQVDEFEIRLDFVDTAIAQQGHAIDADPRASHHLFINLPDPDPQGLIARLVSPHKCDTRYRDLPSLPPSADPSAVVEHAFARLLFDATLGDAAGLCGDYVLHWGATDDACDRLVADPSGFLDGADALDPVLAVLDRRRRIGELRQLDRDLGREPRLAEPPPARGIVSFQCLTVADAATKPVNREVVVGGESLVVRSVRAPLDHPLAAYIHLARLLAGGTYTGAAGDVDVAAAIAPPTAADIEVADMRLTSLELLRDDDPFLSGDWPLASDDLRAIYPLQLHLGNFTDVFRNRYRRERGRL